MVSDDDVARLKKALDQSPNAEDLKEALKDHDRSILDWFKKLFPF